jgi:hypothetical protein
MKIILRLTPRFFAAFLLSWIPIAASAQAPAGLPNTGAGTAFNLGIESYFYNDYPVTVTALSGCSTGGTPSVTGDQKFLIVTAGTSASATCTITWPVTRTVAPICVITAGTAAAVAPFITVVNTTTLTWTYTSVASSVWYIHCQGPR